MSSEKLLPRELIETYKEKLSGLHSEPKTTYIERATRFLDDFRLEHNLSVGSEVYAELFRITTTVAAGKKARAFRE
ncbi:hypothetical protein COU60_01015 [Candidatus Pacearchaeota archaeon CG10_big_fil_rev_8_21_14_0_10_34_76]|nr:MAG: hypothetical protein COU60_01015 [Candidatus Pacearchaeota archaeon CG10_big_fil_rev_8_21_14_0_10_34_76]